jgi:hypothetical protein
LKDWDCKKKHRKPLFLGCITKWFYSKRMLVKIVILFVLF